MKKLILVHVPEIKINTVEVEVEGDTKEERRKAALKAVKNQEGTWNGLNYPREEDLMNCIIEEIEEDPRMTAYRIELRTRNQN